MSKLRLWLGSLLEGNARLLRIDAANGADAGAFLGVHLRVELVAQEPDFAGAMELSITHEEFAVADDAAAEDRCRG